MRIETDTLLGSKVSASARRVDAVDLLRGIVMVIMMLDHTREFVHREVLNFDPTDLTKTGTLLFFTRWITHFCAPIFVFLAGTGAYLQLARGKSKAELSRFLISRGLWLIFLELAVLRFIIWFNIDLHFAFMLQVIWVIGIGMILLAGLIHLPLRSVAIGSLAVIALHNLLDPIQVQSFPAPGKPLPGGWSTGWMLLHQPGMPFLSSSVYGLILYPLVPWVPLLFYIGQWIVSHGLAILVSLLAAKPIGWLLVGPMEQPRPNPGNLGFSLWVVYACWLAGVLLLYPLCRWFAGVKQRRRDWWLSYL